MNQQQEGVARGSEPPSSARGDEFPRSMTVRFLMREPALAMQLLAGAATFLIGPRFVKAATTAVVVARAVRGVTGPDAELKSPAHRANQPAVH